jgi:cytoskeletal protein CcmA (bactofilin family)
MKRISMILLALLLTISSSFAIEVVTGNRIEENDFQEGDYLFAGDSLSFSGIAEDLYFFGNELNLEGSTLKGLMAFGGKLRISGTQENDVIVAGEDIVIDGPIQGTTFAAGSTVMVNNTIDGTLFSAGDTITINETVTRDLYAGARRLFINSTIEGDVYAGAGRIILGENARINGDFTYSSDDLLSEEDLAKISGQVKYEEFKNNNWDVEGKQFFNRAKWIIQAIWSLGILGFAFLLFVFPAVRKMDRDRDHKRFWNTVVFGIIPIAVTPVLFIALLFGLIVAGLTLPTLIALGFGASLILFILLAIAYVQVGAYIAQSFKWKIHNIFLQALMGFTLSALLSLIPIVNVIAGLIFIAVGWGTVLELLFEFKVKKADE